MHGFSDYRREGPERIVIASATVNPTAVATTNILNVSGERGVLGSIAFYIKTAMTGSPVITLRIVTDGSTAMDILLWNSSVTMHANSAGYMARPGSNVAEVGNTWQFNPKVRYFSSCLVAVIVGTGASAGSIDFTTARNVPI